jgi:steroid delta-isomerase-like uncharacterized protein
MSTETTQDILAMIADATTAWNEHDPDAYVKDMDDGCLWSDIGAGQHLVGPPAIRANFAATVAALVDLTIENTTVLISGDSFAIEWVMSGVHAGDLPGLPATGRKFSVPGATVGRVRSGKFTKVTEYWDGADFLRQVGVLPPRPA